MVFVSSCRWVRTWIVAPQPKKSCPYESRKPLKLCLTLCPVELRPRLKRAGGLEPPTFRAIGFVSFRRWVRALFRYRLTRSSARYPSERTPARTSRMSRFFALYR